MLVLEKYEEKAIVESVAQAVNIGGAKQDLLKDIFDALDLDSKVVAALEGIIENAEYEQGELREQINGIHEIEGVALEDYEEGSIEEIDELEAEWDRYDEQIHEANHLINQF